MFVASRIRPRLTSIKKKSCRIEGTTLPETNSESVIPDDSLGGGNSNMFYFHSYLGKISNLTKIFQMG